MAEAQYELAHGRSQEAFRLAKLAERWEKTSPVPLRLQATACDSLGRTAEALQIMQDCCKRFPQDATSWYFLGLAAAAEQNYADGRTAFEKALKLQPDFPAAARNLQALIDFEKRK
jgi:cytochrome c-type biogenesis protein CcmH/NrfG